MLGNLGRIGPARLFVHFAVLLIVIIWLIPTLGIFVTALRDKDQIVVSGWWTSFSGSSRTIAVRLAGSDKATQDGANYIIKGNVFDGSNNNGSGRVRSFGLRVQEPAAYQAGSQADLGDGESLTINSDGTYLLQRNGAFAADERARRVYLTVATPPEFTRDNYRTVLTGEGIGQSFINSLTVAIPATIIPILIAAFAAYALAWMDFRGRALLIALVVGLIVVPLQMSLIPLLRIYNDIGQVFGVPSKTYPGIWMAHTAFGLPLAIYLLRNYIAGLPKEIIESARVDGASDFDIFVKIILPLSFPALASFAIFQFLWVWNDLLIAMVFLGTDKDHLVLTAALNALLGSRGGNWEILTASAFVTILIPLLVFFGLQRYLVRGLLAGSVKGG
ncbi:carbohydrate ABC transporter permease [Rhizobium jaguaris]|uniref:Carbohydrate ABC transporter permease n=1 Tax=Rhizobium jaguaris TaxID=1312183 RepID=A0A387FS80_9HYPH|nr:carbohydrate ABC transporter permease [Rhizobium jaguaris]AYG58132.1 carbohydrate ABC transporter permease [Rhizobium jaguaris]